MDGLGLAEFYQGLGGDIRVGGRGRLLVEPQCGRPVVQYRLVQLRQVDPRMLVSQVDGALEGGAGPLRFLPPQEAARVGQRLAVTG